MEIRITRGKEFLKDKKIRFTLTIETLSLSAEEHALVAKYGDPLVKVHISALLPYERYPKDCEPDIVSTAEALSKFKVTASIIGELPSIRNCEQASVERLREHLAYLRALDKWEGEEKLSL